MANLQVIKVLLREKNITIRDFSSRIGLTEQGLQKLIRENTTRVDTLEAIARELNVSIVEFFDQDVAKINEKETIVSIKDYLEVIKTQSKTILLQQETIKTFTTQVQKRTA